jgi:cytochrome b561
MPNAAPRYTATAIALHWLLALMILVSLSDGWYMTGLQLSPLKLKLYNWHKWTGVTILALSLLRLLWRLTHRPPPLSQRIEATMPPWQLKAYHAAHGLMYALFFLVPLAGWTYSSMAGFPVVWFGVLPLPDFVPVDKELAKLIKPVHALLAYTLLALIALHVAAAVKHHFIDHDGLLARMRPGHA